MKERGYVVINAVKKSRGEFNGKEYDSTKVFAYILDDVINSDNEKGYFMDEFNIGKSFEFDLLMKNNIDFPAFCSADIERVKSAKGYKVSISNIEFLKKIDLLSFIE